MVVWIKGMAVEMKCMDLRHVFLDKMPRCRNSSQIKEQGKVIGRALNESYKLHA